MLEINLRRRGRRIPGDRLALRAVLSFALVLWALAAFFAALGAWLLLLGDRDAAPSPMPLVWGVIGSGWLLLGQWQARRRVRRRRSMTEQVPTPWATWVSGGDPVAAAAAARERDAEAARRAKQLRPAIWLLLGAGVLGALAIWTQRAGLVFLGLALVAAGMAIAYGRTVSPKDDCASPA